MNLRFTNLSTLLVQLSDKLEYTVKMYYKITAISSENYIKHTKALFSATCSTLYVKSGCTHCSLFLSQIHWHARAYTPTRMHKHKNTHTHTHTCTHMNIHTYTYYVVTTGLSTVHISQKY